MFELMWVQADVLGLFLGSVGSFSDNVGTKLRCSRAERFMFSRRYTYLSVYDTMVHCRFISRLIMP